MPKIIKLGVSIAGSVAAGAIGTLATTPNIPTWYAALEKPFFNPPNWVFGPVWTTLYILMGVSLYLVWTASYKDSKQSAISLFIMQLILNAAWSLAFFGLHALWTSVVIIVLLVAAIICTMRLFWPVSHMATYLLVPYLAWVSFATVLTISIALLNT